MDPFAITGACTDDATCGVVDVITDACCENASSPLPGTEFMLLNPFPATLAPWYESSLVANLFDGAPMC
jgi:hypothetical protein